GAFYPNSRLQVRDIRDGMSKTMCLAEVKGYTPYERNAGSSGEIALPNSPDDLPAGGEMKWGEMVSANTGHTAWVDGRAHQTGFTTVFAPNSDVSPQRAGGRDLDWTNMQEGKSPSIRTYAAVTS